MHEQPIDVALGRKLIRFGSKLRNQLLGTEAEQNEIAKRAREAVGSYSLLVEALVRALAIGSAGAVLFKKG